MHNETSVSYTNNVIKIHNNIEIRKDNVINVETAKVPVNVIYDSVIKDASNVIAKDVLLTDTNKDTLKIPSIMSQKSLDLVVDNLTSDICRNEVKKPEVKLKQRKILKPLPKIIPPKEPVHNDTPTKTVDLEKKEDYEVIIKLPNGKQVRMKAVEELSSPENNKIENNTKEKLKLAISNKVSQKNNTVFQRLQSVNTVPSILPISTGTLIPVTIVNTTAPIVQKIPIAPFNALLKSNQGMKKTIKRKTNTNLINNDVNRKPNDAGKSVIGKELDDDCVIVDEDDQRKRSKEDLDSRVAASRRYR